MPIYPGYWLETIALYEGDKAINEKSSEIIDYSQSDDYILQFYASYRPEYKTVTHKLKNKIRKFRSKDEILKILAPDMKDKNGTSLILDEIYYSV